MAHFHCKINSTQALYCFTASAIAVAEIITESKNSRVGSLIYFVLNCFLKTWVFNRTVRLKQYCFEQLSFIASS